MKGLGRVQRTILAVLEERGARDLSTALLVSSLAGDVRDRIGERWTPTQGTDADPAPDPAPLVTTFKTNSHPPVEPAASTSISRGIRTLEKRGLVHRVLSRVWLSAGATANGLDA